MRALPAQGEPMPTDIDPERDFCDTCGDLIAYCPLWTRRWPELSHHDPDGRWE